MRRRKLFAARPRKFHLLFHPMRLLVVNRQLDRPESAIYQGLARRGLEVEVCCEPGAGYREALAQAGVGLRDFSVSGRLDFSAIRHLRRIFSKFCPDAVYAPHNQTLSAALLARGGARFPIVGYRGTSGHLHRLDPACYLTYFHPRLDHIVCVSHAVEDYLLGQRVPSSRLTTIHKGHDPAWYAAPPALSREDLGLSDSDIVVGFIGNLRPVKGFDVLLAAAHLLPPDLPVKFLVIGSAEDRRVRRLAAEAGALPSFVLAGPQPQASRLAKLFDLTVMPSVEREGLPRAVIEAMAQRVPPVVSSVGGMVELVEDGKSGLVVPPRDPACLAAAICQLARDPALRTRMGEAARQRIAQDFHVDRTTDRMQALFERLATR